jgi:hypothetical protein
MIWRCSKPTLSHGITLTVMIWRKNIYFIWFGSALIRPRESELWVLCIRIIPLILEMFIFGTSSFEKSLCLSNYISFALSFLLRAAKIGLSKYNIKIVLFLFKKNLKVSRRLVFRHDVCFFRPGNVSISHTVCHIQYVVYVEARWLIHSKILVRCSWS